MKIERLETYHLGRSLWAELWEREKDLPLVTPLSAYPEYRHPYSSWYWDPALTLVVLTADDGKVGLGWTEDGVAAARSIIERHLKRFVLGASPIPFSANATLTPLVALFSYAFTGSEPAGTYFTYAGLAIAGSNPLLPSNQLSLGVQAFQFNP